MSGVLTIDFPSNVNVNKLSGCNSIVFWGENAVQKLAAAFCLDAAMTTAKGKHK